MDAVACSQLSGHFYLRLFLLGITYTLCLSGDCHFWNACDDVQQLGGIFLSSLVEVNISMSRIVFIRIELFIDKCSSRIFCIFLVHSFYHRVFGFKLWTLSCAMPLLCGSFCCRGPLQGTQAQPGLASQSGYCFCLALIALSLLLRAGTSSQPSLMIKIQTLRFKK